MDITKALAPKSDQANADDFLTGPRTFTVENVQEGSEQQPVNVYLVEYPRKPFRPSKSMLRVLAAGWGPKVEAWAGRRLTLYTDPDVMFGGEKVGGIRISHMSHLRRPLSVPLTITRGNKRPFKVEPLNEQPATPQIRPEQKQQIHELAQSLNIEQASKWCSDQLGRTVKAWEEITEAEAQRLIAELESTTPKPTESETT